MKKNYRGFMLTKGLLLTGLCVGMLLSFASCSKLMIARDGTTQYTIVQSENATEPEKYAVQELTNFLSRVTGASFPVVTESKLAGKTRGIYVGWTEYAERNGIEASKLGEEEWIIRSVGNNLILTGGRPRGTLYAVYEFLERQIGCHWLDRKTEVIPVMPTLKLGKLDIRGKPWFWTRAVHSPTGTPEDKWKFMIRNKNYRYDFRGCANMFPRGAFYPLNGSPGTSHTFSHFVNAKDWFETHPEYFSLDASGKRLPAYGAAGPGQLCLTHPDVRRLTLEKLREYIAMDRKRAAEGYISKYLTISNAVPPPRIYTISQNDKYHAHCKCTNCQAIAKREGSESGPLIDFINAIAEDIEKDYPDIFIKTSAYNLTQPPPKTIRPRNNVIIGWCDVYSRCDGLRPLSHPWNKHHYEEIKAWGKIAPRPGIGDDYWATLSYYGEFPLPWTMAQCLGPDIRHYADCGCKTYFAEAAHYIDPGKNFIQLEYWLAYKLLDNPYHPVEPLINIFMDGYYGGAAAAMKKYYKYLTERIDKEAQFMMMRHAPHQLAYLDLDFFVTAQKLFDEAESRVKPGSREDAHVQRERFIVDSALLYLWPWMARSLPAGQTLPFDHEQLVQRFEQGWKNYEKHWYNRYYRKGDPNGHNKDGQRMQRLAALFRDPKLPEQFRSLPRSDVADFNWLTFSSIRPRQKFVVDDDAAGGMAAESTGISAIMAAEEGAPTGDKTEKAPSTTLTFGVTGGSTITLKPAEIPQDGKYHLYKIGRVDIKPSTTVKPGSKHFMTSPGTTVWALKGKKLGVCVDRVYVPDAVDPNANVWNAYISLKVKGPAFVKGSTETNGVWMDRVLLVKPQPGDKPDAAELKRLEEKKKQDARRPHVSVPCLPANAGGDPQKIDWKKSVNAGKWSTLKGASTARKVEARFAQDGIFFYIRLTEEVNTKTLINEPGIFGGDDWELFFAAKRGEQPYRQMAINPKGKHLELAYGENSWKSGANVISETGDNLWKVSLGFPLDKLLPGGVKPGQTVYANIFRGGKDPLAWSPTFEGNFHSLDRMGEIILQ
ncbi:DUF4838 domain-containing protein [Verrucomicrobiota bacterium]